MKRIVILHSDVASDAALDDLDTLQQVETISAALASLGHDPISVPFDFNLNATSSTLISLKPDAVFNLVETVAGRGSMIYFATALLDSLGIAYTGCRTNAMYLTSNKPLTKKFLSSAGIYTPAWRTLDGYSEGIAPSETYILKASWEDASVGLDDDAVFRTDSPAMLIDALRQRRQTLGLECFAEAYIHGREFNIALLASSCGVRILPASEILFEDYPSDKLKLLDYRAKWVEDSFEYDKTRRTLDMDLRDKALIDRLHEISLQCWRLFGLRGYARVDFRVDDQGLPWVLEINANPCLSPDAGFAASLDYAGIKFEQAIDDILRDALI